VLPSIPQNRVLTTPYRPLALRIFSAEKKSQNLAKNKINALNLMPTLSFLECLVEVCLSHGPVDHRKFQSSSKYEEKGHKP
jgi:hypothetical protein